MTFFNGNPSVLPTTTKCSKYSNTVLYISLLKNNPCHFSVGRIPSTTEKSDVQERKEFVSSWILASHQPHRTITEDFHGGLESGRILVVGWIQNKGGFWWWVGFREIFGSGFALGKILVVGLY